MSMECLKRATPLLVIALMVAKVFSPAMGTLKLSTAAPGMDSAGGSFPGKMASAAGSTGPRRRSVSRVHASQAGAGTGIHYSGITAAPIEDDDRVIPFGGGNTFGVRRVSAVPGPDTFTEIFEIAAPRSVALEGAESFLAAWTLQSETWSAIRSEWFVREERSHSVRLPVIGHRNVTLEDAIAMGAIPEDITARNIAPEDLVRDESAPGTVIIRVPCIAGTRTVERSRPEWVPLASSGLALNAGETRLFKVIHRAR
jgi:hypothetical protein